MDIPVIFYLRYWLRISFMAAVLGLFGGWFFLGIFGQFFSDALRIFGIFGQFYLDAARIFMYLSVLIAIIPLLIYQISAYRHFWGMEKGHFEYYYREFLLDQAAKSLFQKTIGTPEFFWIYPGEHFPYILDHPEVKTDPNLQFIAFLNAAQAALKEYDCRKEIEYLRKAVSLRLADLVANCRLANAMERIGNAPAAISAYQAALSDPSLDSTELREFIAAQIKRVESQGPTQKPPIPGLRHMIY